ncbi:MAG: MtnX-like HAD-IB family phosphatase [Chloroflexota bacterium]|nr:MtnX-like HAD-IB family phosphatase [Chloroflexota bacterium]
MIPAILTDFDDTAAVQNVAEMLLHKFGDDSWQDVRERFRGGELTLKEYQEITFSNIQADRATMQEYVKNNAVLRPHFTELWEYCKELNSPMAIVSLGLDFYIQALLEKEGAADVPTYCVNTRFTPDGIAYYYHHTYPGEAERGNSKGLIVDRYRQLGYHVIYVGDGRSDFEGAERADTVFAHSFLAEECQRQGVSFRPFTDFGDVMETTRELLGLTGT